MGTDKKSDFNKKESENTSTEIESASSIRSEKRSDSNKIDSKNLPPDAPVPRLCHLVKWPDFDGFGFNLQVGQYIGKVDPDSPAELADLREGDQILEVNGVPISNENHKQVVQRIKAIPNETRLLVINQNDYGWYKDRNLVIRSTQKNVIHCKTPVPRPGSSFLNDNENRKNQSQMNGTKNELLNESLNTNESLDLKSDNQKNDREDSPLAEEIFNALEAKQSSSTDEISNKLASTKLQNETTTNSTIESNNNNEKAANQNLVSPVKNVAQKSHNFIIVNSEKEFANEKRLKEEQMKNNLMNTNLTPIKAVNKEAQLNNNHMDSSTSSISSSNNNLSMTPTNSSDLNLNMSASEMRKIIASRRNVKADCKKQPLDLRQKYEIIQQM